MSRTRFPTSAAGRLVALAGALALAGSLAAPAGAQSGGDTYSAASRADAVLLQAGGGRVSVGSATAAGASTPSASATGTGFFTPGHEEGATSAEVTADGQQAGSEEPTCSQLTTPDDMPLVSITNACSTAQASVQGGLPHAAGTATSTEIGIGIASLPGASEPLGDAADQIVEGLGPIFDGIGETGIDAETLFSELLDALIDGDAVTVVLGESTADVAEDEDGRVTATAGVDGATIGLFDRPEVAGVDLGPMVTVTIGSSAATVVRTRSTGQSVPSFLAAPVTITLAPDVHAALPPEFPATIELPPGGSECIPLPPPLESCITAGGGTTETADDGTVTASASAVRLDLLTGLPEGGIVIGMSTAEAGIAAAVPAAPTTTSTTSAPTTSAPVELPRTGGPGPWLPIAGWGLLGAAVLTGGAARLAGGRRAG